jgi:hypothetical protein
MAIRYVDNTLETSTITGANWQFTNASTTVTETGAAGNALAEVAANDYIRTNGGTQWYKVSSVTDDDNIEITPAFQQANNTDTCKLNSEDGTVIAQSFAHVNQALEDEARVAGDIIKVRANQTHIYSGVITSTDDAGAANNRITLKGADSSDDPWSDGSDVRPIFDYGLSGQFYLFINNPFWNVEHLDLIGAVSLVGVLRILNADHVTIDDCRIYDNGTGATHLGMGAGLSADVNIINCTFDNNFGKSIDFSSSTANIENCIFDGDTVGGGNGTDYGIEVSSGRIYLRDCTFGVTDEHDLADIFVSSDCVIYGRNVKLDSTTEVATNSANDVQIIRLEDDEQTHLAFRAWLYPGNLSRTTAVERSGAGGTAWSILGEPNSNCGANEPLYIIGDWLRGIPIYLDGSSQTITMWAYADSTGGGWTPNAAEFFFELDYYNGVADWQQAVTTDTFAAEDQWESFAITVTADAAGPAYLRAVLKDNVAGGKIYIDPEPVFS